MTLILSGTDGISDVDGSAATPAVRGTDTNTGLFFPAADTIGFAEGGAEVARITNTGAWSFGASGTATGTNGQVLTSAGSAAAPTWAAPSTGALVYLSTVIASNSATVDVETTFNSTYRAYLIVGTGVFCSAAGALLCRLKINGTYATNAYGYHRHNMPANSTTYDAAVSDNGSNIPMSGALSTARSADFVMTVYFPSDTVSEKVVDWRLAPGRLNDNISTGAVGYASQSGTEALTGVRFYFASGNVASGEFRLYGIANS